MVLPKWLFRKNADLNLKVRPRRLQNDSWLERFETQEAARLKHGVENKSHIRSEDKETIEYWQGYIDAKKETLGQF